MGLGSAITLLEDVFVNTSFFNTLMIPQIIIVVATMLLITRNVSNWKKLAFPVMVGWVGFGMNISTIMLVIAGIMFTIDHLSIKINLGNLIPGENIITRKGRYKTLTKAKQKKWDLMLKQIEPMDRYRNLSKHQLKELREIEAKKNKTLSKKRERSLMELESLGKERRKERELKSQMDFLAKLQREDIANFIIEEKKKKGTLKGE